MMRDWCKNLRLPLTLLCILFSLTGCGDVESIVESATNSVPDSGSGEAEEAADYSDFDWRTSEWKRTSSRGKGNALYIGEYVEALSPIAELNYDSIEFPVTTTYKSFIYSLDQYMLENRNIGNYMYRYDVDTGDTSYTELDTDSLLGGESEAEIISFDIYSEEEYVFLRVKYEDGHKWGPEWREDDEVCGLTAVHMDAEGNLIKTVDLYPGVTESGYLTDMGWGNYQRLNVDSQGNYYYYASYSGGGVRKMAVLDPDGHVLCVVNPYPDGLEGAMEQEITAFECLMKDPDGFPVFYLPHPNRSESMLLTYDQQRGGIRQTPLPYLGSVNNTCMTEDGMCYFVSGSDGTLYRWNLCTGGILELMNIAAEDITTNTYFLRLLTDSAGRLCLYEIEDEGFSLYTLTEEEPSAEGNMNVVSLTSNCTLLQAAAADYTRKHGDQGITVEYDAEDPQAYRDRLMLDLTAGKGPEVMYVSRVDMESLYEKGLLEDMTEVLSPETVERIFPGVLECGRIDGRQIGFAMEAELRTMLVNREVWDKESWRLEDVVSLLEEGERWPKLQTVVAMGVQPFGTAGALWHLTLQNIEQCPFLNLEENTCSFDSEEFIHLLELCKQYGTVLPAVNIDVPMQEGKALAYVDDFSNLQMFCIRVGSLGEDFHCVGYPTESGCGSYWSSDYYLVVRKGADCMDTVKGYLEFLYSTKYQRKQDTPLCREVYDRYVHPESPNNPGYQALDTGQGKYHMLMLKPDGSSCVDDFLELAEKSGPLPQGDEMIGEIVMEEAESFFAGDKDAATVAGIIQSRIRLYLAEHSHTD
ncbi:MAG: ABC transporter substrate-binding protein [bacterium]|nr:ABC transporter substrate-binding protein [bacterium]MCM1375508.1 ABC transporter substrate-binding protein [Muribaculum sp.]